MLVDSSVWIGFLRGDDCREVRHLLDALTQRAPVWLAPPILQEVLQGADTPERFLKWERTLGQLPLLPSAEPRKLARDAANVYARCRWKGITLRSANDCLIAQYAIETGMPLLHRDRDFVAIASVEARLKLVGA